jgi:hypothetical protein
MSASATSMVCEEKARLIRQHLEAIDKYFGVTKRELERKRATTNAPDYKHLAEAVVESGRFVKLCRDALLRHVTQHGCI